MTQQINEIRKENQELIEQIKKETREIIKEEINTVRNELNLRLDSVEEVVKENELKTSNEIKNINKRIIANNKRLEENFTAHKGEINKYVKDNNEASKNRIKELEEKIGNNVEEIDGKLTSIQNNVRSKFAQVGTIPINRVVPTEQIKEIKFNGESEFPMEFLKEITELQREYYPTNGILWIARHLEGEAAIWWRLVKDRLTSFDEFTEAFINKFWN